MARYKITADGVGPWKRGDVISDQDLKDNPQYGGVERLRDQLGSIEDTLDQPAGKAQAPAKFTATGGEPENTTGNQDKQNKAAAERFRADHGVDESGKPSGRAAHK